MYLNMDWQLLLNLDLYHSMSPYSGLQDVLGNDLACPVLVSLFMWWQFKCLCQTTKLLAIERYSWKLNTCPQDSECYCSHLNFWVKV